MKTTPLRREILACPFLLLTLGLLLGSAAGPSAAAAAAAPEARPNILFISIDDMADWIPGLALPGYPTAHAPNFDRLMKRGVLFTEAYTVSPHCGPSRAAMLTGLRPETTKAYTGLGAYRNYVPDVVAFPEYFRRHGYQVAGAGKVNHRYAEVPLEEGWMEYGPRTGIVGSPFTREELLQANFKPRSHVKRPTWELTLPLNGILKHDRVNNEFATFDWGPVPVPDDEMPDGRIAAWAVEQLGRRYDRPFFLAVGFYKPHLPWFAPQRYFDLNPLPKMHKPPLLDGDLDDLSRTAKDFARLIFTAGGHSTILESGQWERAIQGYLACISFVDAQLGRLLDALDRSEHARNTVIMLWSDHGFMLGEKEHWGKFAPWQRSNRVPFIVAPTAEARSRRPELAGTRCDVPTTALDIYPTLIDLARLPKKPDLEGRSLAPQLANPRQPGAPAAVSTIGRGTHAVRHGQWLFIRYFDGAEELYDLTADPYEWHNLAGDPRHESVKEASRRFLPLDPDVRQYVRYRGFKAVFYRSGKVELYNFNAERGISEERNVAADNPGVVAEINRRLARDKLTGMFVGLADE